MKADKRSIYGPQRDTQAAAQADLQVARQLGSRDAMVSFLQSSLNRDSRKPALKPMSEMVKCLTPRLSSDSHSLKEEKSFINQEYCSMGSVHRSGYGWRIQLCVDGRMTYGPQRDTQAMAQADLDTARQRAARLEIQSFPIALANEIRRVRELHCSIGSVRRTCIRWRADLHVDGRTVLGPPRDTQVAAQADLEAARQRGSRSEMVSFLESLANS